MEKCYPAIILFILAIFLAINLGRKLWWGAGIVFGLIPLFFSLLCLSLCKKGYTKLAWIAPLGALLFLGFIMANV